MRVSPRQRIYNDIYFNCCILGFFQYMVSRLNTIAPVPNPNALSRGVVYTAIGSYVLGLSEKTTHECKRRAIINTALSFAPIITLLKLGVLESVVMGYTMLNLSSNFYYLGIMHGPVVERMGFILCANISERLQRVERGFYSCIDHLYDKIKQHIFTHS